MGQYSLGAAVFSMYRPNKQDDKIYVCTELDLLECGRFRILVFEGRIISMLICDIKLSCKYTELNTIQ